MAEHHFTGDEDWPVGFDAGRERGFRTLAYTGNLGGGVLQIKTSLSDNVQNIPLSNAKLSAATLDGNGDVVQQIVFQSDGKLTISLSGSTGPDAWVAIL